MKKRMIALTLVLAMLLSGIPMIGSASEPAQPQIPEPVVGTTNMLGGGGYVHLRIGNNSDFGVIYGTPENPNSIIIVSKVVKYVGSVDAYDSNGAKIAQGRPIKVGMLFAQRLDTLVEFNDSNGNGIFDYTGLLPYEGTLVHEPVYKRVSLRTAWERSNITKTEDGNNTTWSFSLTAHNLTYIPVGDSGTIDEQVANDTLDTIRFTFHLTAQRVYVGNAMMPHFSLTVSTHRGAFGRNRYSISSMQRSMQPVSGWKTVYKAKYDQYIEGWDFDPTNTNPALLLEFHSIFGHYVPLYEAQWIRQTLCQRIGANGTATYETQRGEENVTDTTALPDDQQTYQFRAMQLRHRFIEVDDSWEKVARLTWVSNVTVDGQQKQMYAQVQGGIRIPPMLVGGQAFAGFAIIGGFSYPGGNVIFHDPEVSGEAFTDIASRSPTSSAGMAHIAAIGIVGIAALIGATGFYIYRKKKKNELDDLAESALPEEENR